MSVYAPNMCGWVFCCFGSGVDGSVIWLIDSVLQMKKIQFELTK